MMQFILNSFILLTGFIFSQLTHPLSMGLMLLLQTLLISLLIGLMSKTFWFAYILFLVFLGGMLVMFIYVTALSSNELFNLSKYIFFIAMMMISMSLFLYLIIDLYYTYNIMNYEMFNFFNTNMYVNENTLNLNKLYNYSSNIITLFLINYLFLTLVICVKITNFFYGPLRPSF